MPKYQLPQTGKNGILFDELVGIESLEQNERGCGRRAQPACGARASLRMGPAPTIVGIAAWLSCIVRGTGLDAL